MLHRKPFDDLDNALAKLDAFIRLISHLQDIDPADRAQLREGEGFIAEAMIAESYRARQAFDLAWRGFSVANDWRVS